VESDLPLPVQLISGRVHELRLNVPWTALTNQPVKITLSTLEIVVGPRSATSAAAAAAAAAAAVAASAEPSPRPPSSPAPPAQVSSGGSTPAPVDESAGLLGKILNNLSIVVQNLVVKYVDEDSVLSISCKSLSLSTANRDWQREFAQDYLGKFKLLHRLFECSELTVCLDKRGSDGKIDYYHDPMLYRLSFNGRLRMYGEVPQNSEPQYQVFCPFDWVHIDPANHV